MATVKSLLVFLVVLCLAATASADEQVKVFGNYEVHYNALNSTFLTPEVASAYGITRGKDRALVNISVRERLPDGSTRASKALIKGSTFDLIHTVPLEFHEVDERDAIYYIAQTRITNYEPLTFRIQVRPVGDSRSYQLNFNKTLYVQ